MIMINILLFQNTLAADAFNARLTQANLVTKTDCDAKLFDINIKLLQINQNICLLKMN